MQLEVEKLIRVMHSVKCVSGPTIEQKMHRGNAWGYILEFVLVAAVPFMFGITRPVTLSPSLPTVVQDVPFNLVPYPSAELELGTVIAAVNYSANPSVEVDATGWSHTSTGVVATDVTGARSTALSAQGAASFRSHFVATNSGSNGVVVAQNVSSTFPVAVAGARMSINMWATAQVVSGTAVISKTEVVAVWRAGSSVLRTDIVGTTPAGGGAVTGKSIAVPVGADNVVIQARATLASWSTGATVDVYADAVGASVP